MGGETQKCIKIGENVTNNTQVYQKDAFEIATTVFIVSFKTHIWKPFKAFNNRGYNCTY